MGGYVGVGIVFLILITFLQTVIRLPYNRLKFDKFRQNNYHIESFEEHFRNIGFPVIKLGVDNDLKYFLVDTGSSLNLIRKEYYDSMVNKPEVENGTDIHTGNGIVQSQKIKLNLTYKNLDFNNETFDICQLNVFDLHKEKYGIDIVGIVGSPIFYGYDWSVDYESLNIFIKK